LVKKRGPGIHSELEGASGRLTYQFLAVLLLQNLPGRPALIGVDTGEFACECEEVRRSYCAMLERVSQEHSFLLHVSCGAGFQLTFLCGEIPLTYPEGDVDQPDERRNFNERADHADECLSRI